MKRGFTLSAKAIRQLDQTVQKVQGFSHVASYPPDAGRSTPEQELYPQNRFRITTWFNGGWKYGVFGNACPTYRESGSGTLSGNPASGYIAGHVWGFTPNVSGSGGATLKANVLEYSGVSIANNTQHQLYCDIIFSGSGSGLYAELKYSTSGLPLLFNQSGNNTWTRFPVGSVTVSGGRIWSETWCPGDIVLPLIIPGSGGGGDSTIRMVKLTGNIDNTTYSGNVYGSGVYAAATESGVIIRVWGMASGETLRSGVPFSATKQDWSGTLYWTLVEPARII